MTNAHDFSFTKLDEPGAIAMRDFAGKVILIVNVASACGFTPQYRELESLYESMAPKGLVVIAAPCNDFGAQESGSEKDIREFCNGAYHVTFPVTGKIEIVAPARRHPFYAWVADELGEGALPRWNFHKYLVGKDGGLIDGFPSKVAPLSLNMLEAIKAALAA